MTQQLWANNGEASERVGKREQACPRAKPAMAEWPWAKRAAGTAEIGSESQRRKVQGANQQRSLCRDKRPMGACEQAVVNCIFDLLSPLPLSTY